ncbi:MAG: SWI/SNF-related matrix-associated actin-dependent regulator of chromatin subfamily A-like protein 1 [Thermoplasmata archaeon]|jgi:SWI/SNF-related matrix-associated actin-dependent regulator 1 of chromatin subfamily A|nr:SWI/SNF-related matrix-associated actin-dependent regulator of chromatin subfamily A-like protein 1 [Thermoplasmata archaeon]
MRLTWAADAFRLAKAPPESILKSLRERDLQVPTWDLDLRTWAYGDDEEALLAIRFLVETNAVEPDEEAKARLTDLGLFHAPGEDKRIEHLESLLRPYQKEGVGYALTKRRILLADSMGLGKSLQALVAVEKAGAYPCVVVCPSAVKLGWQREVVKWVPWRSAQVVVAGRDKLQGANMTVLNPELLPRHLDELKAMRPKALILDEAHFFKNPDSQRSRNALELSRGVGLRMALTGTPIKNRREDLVHQLRILDQLEPVLHIYRGLLPHWYRPEMGPMAEPHAIRVLQGLDARTLNARLREVCMVRRTKEEVAPDLPPLTRTRIEVVPGHLKAYRQKERAMLDWVRKWHEKYGAQAAAMEPAMTLQFRSHLTGLRREAALAKVPFAKEWVEPLVESGERVVFFAYHKDVVARLAEGLPGRVATITGDTPAPQRRAILDALGHYDFLVATMDSTGYGVDGIQLHASHVAFVELDWTPTKHEQCEGRLHRIGQEDPVNSWYFVATNTIDRAMMEVLEAKWSDIQGVVEGRGEDDALFLGQLLRSLVAQAEHMSGPDNAEETAP